MQFGKDIGAAPADRRRQRRGSRGHRQRAAQQRHRGAPVATGERGRAGRPAQRPDASSWCWPRATRSSVPVEQVMQAGRPPAARTCRCCCCSTRVDDARLLEALALGARGVVLRGRIDHIQSTVHAEWDRPRGAPALRRLEAQVRETERRCDALIESSRDPIAYVHEGMHIRANAGLPGDVRLRVVRGNRRHVAARHDRAAARRRLQAAAQADVQGRAAAAALRGRGPHARRQPFPGGDGVHPRHLRRRELPAAGAAPDRSSTRNWPARSRNCASATRSPACSTAPRSCARSRTAWPTPAQNATPPRPAAGRTGPLRAPAAGNRPGRGRRTGRRVRATPAQRARPGRCRRALRRAPVRGAQPQQRPRAPPRDWPKPCAPRSPTTCWKPPDRSLNATVSIGGVQIGEKIASVTAVLGKASQGVQSTIGVGGNRIELFDPGAVDRAEEERVEAWVDAHPRRARCRPLPDALPAADQPARRAGRDVRGLPAPAGRARRTGAAADLPADRRGARPAVGNRPLGRGPRDRGDRRAPQGRQAHHVAGQDHPGLAAGRQPAQAHRRNNWPSTAPTAACWCCSCPSPRCSPTCAPAQEFQAARGRATACASGWSSSARASIRSSC